MDNIGITKAIDKVLRFTDPNGKPLTYDGIKIKEDKCFTVLMMGPRRCGKTSVLTSINRCTKQVSANSSIVCVPRGEFKSFFIKKEEELIDFANNPANFLNGANGNSGISATSEISFYDFVLYHPKNKKNIFMLRFIDANGEFYRDFPEEMSRLVKESDMIIVAIDTPALMMENQSLANKMNGYNYINDYFGELELEEGTNTTKLVLFAPLKCEYLYRRDEDMDSNCFMNSVVQQIQIEYKQMIDKLSNKDFKDLISIAVTPILTIGGVKFISYETDENSEYKKDKEGLALANYIVDTKYSGYHPLYCEQPIYYLLAYMNNLLLETKENNEKNISKFFKKVPIIRKILVDKDMKFLSEIKTIANRIIVNEKGFAIISDEKARLRKNE